MASLEEMMAHSELARQGSVMARPQLPEWRRQLPEYLGPTAGTAAQAGLNLVDLLLAFGPTPQDAFGGGLARLANKVGLAALLTGGDPESGMQDAGFFRQAGLKRVGGDIGTRQWLAEIMQHPRYERFKELSQNMVRKSLGEEFPIYRGKGQTDPIMKALLSGNPADLPPTIATTLDPNIAEDFARHSVEKTRKPAYVMKGKASPEAVPGLLPKRNTHGHEEEVVVLTEKLLKKPQLAAKAIDTGTGMVEFVTPRTPSQPPQPIESLQAMLAQSAPVPSPFQAAAPTSGPMSYYNLPRAGRSFPGPTDLERQLAGEILSTLGSQLPPFRK